MEIQNKDYDVRQEWLRTQLHWDDRSTIQSRRIPRSVVLNWRKMTYIMWSLCEEKYISQGSKLLLVDIGCGAGKFYDGLEAIVGSYIGIDPSDRMLPAPPSPPRARGGWGGNRDRIFIRGAGEHLPLRSSIVDIIVLKSVLDQCYAPHQVISESYRVLKRGGWLLISLSNRDAYYALLRNIYTYLRRYKSRHFFQESHQFFFDMMDAAMMVKKGQFEIIRQVPIGYFVFPRCLEWLMTERVLLRCIDLTDRIGSAILPLNGGGFIFVGQKL